MQARISQRPRPSSGPSSDTILDRRRPGRAPVEDVLVPLLRRGTNGDVLPDETLDGTRAVEEQSDEQGSLAKGVVVGLLLSVPFWTAVAFAWVRWLR